MSILPIANNLTKDRGTGGGNFVPSWLFLNNGSFVPPETGKYRVICIGKGGNGGKGSSTSSGNSGRAQATSGAGGGSGGVGISILELSKEKTYTFSISDSSTNFDNGMIIANAGKSGANGSYTISSSESLSTPIGGAGGSVNGSNVDFKYAGQKGQNGKNTGTAGINDPWYSTKATGGKGASVSCCLRFDAITPSSVGAFITPKEDRGESYIEDSKANEKTYIISTYSGYAGAGGDGSPAFASYTYSTSYSHHITDGGKGGPGAVIIEYLG